MTSQITPKRVRPNGEYRASSAHALFVRHGVCIRSNLSEDASDRCITCLIVMQESVDYIRYGVAQMQTLEGESNCRPLRPCFDCHLKLEFRGSRASSDADPPAPVNSTAPSGGPIDGRCIGRPTAMTWQGRPQSKASDIFCSRRSSCSRSAGFKAAAMPHSCTSTCLVTRFSTLCPDAVSQSP